MPDHYFEPNPAALLLGAGFSKDFGGYLASEMWAAVFNRPEVSTTPVLRQALLEKLDFEGVYEDLSTDTRLSPVERWAIESAYRNAYQEMDERQCSRAVLNSPAGVCSQSFLRYFAGCTAERRMGFLFTLNQDLLLERFWAAEPNLHLPGLRRRGPALGRHPIQETDWVDLPSEDDVAEARRSFWSKSSQCFAQIKLHGSFGWKNSAKAGAAMVIGKNKEGLIRKVPLLRWYGELFEEVLKHLEHLLVIGYSFRDEHINRLVTNALSLGRLKLSVIDILTPADFRDRLIGRRNPAPFGKNLWQGLFHYESARISDLCDSGQPSVALQAILRKLQIYGF